MSFSHGANDGQKGIGLVMLVLIGVAPAGFVVNMNASGYEITRTRDAVNNVETFFQQRPELLKKAPASISWCLLRIPIPRPTVSFIAIQQILSTRLTA